MQETETLGKRLITTDSPSCFSLFCDSGKLYNLIDVFSFSVEMEIIGPSCLFGFDIQSGTAFVYSVL